MHTKSFYKMTIGFAVVCLTACHSASPPSQNMYQPAPTIVEPGLAYSQPCSPPCWQGLTPGKSKSTDVAKAITELQTNGWASSVRGSPEDGFTAYPSPDTIHGAVSVYVESGVVSYTFGNLLFDYSVGELVRQLGEPESLYSLYRRQQPSETSCADYDFEQAVSSSPTVILYPSRGMIFLASAPLKTSGLVCPKVKILAFCYYTPRSIEDALKDDYVAKVCGIDALKGVAESDLIKWPGFDVPY